MEEKRDKLLTVKEVAKWLDVTEGWVRSHANKRRRPFLPAVHMGHALRFRESEITRFINDCNNGVYAA